MTQFEDTAFDPSQSNQKSSTNSSGQNTANRNKSNYLKRFSLTPPTAADKLPIRLNGGNTTSLHSSGVAFASIANRPTMEAEHGPITLFSSDDFKIDREEALLCAQKSLLIRLNLSIRDSELTRVLCTSERIGCTGARFIIPCQLGLTQGRILAMELFLPSFDNTLPVRGKIREITPINGDDMIRYAVEVDFEGLTNMDERLILSFVYESQLEDRRQFKIQ